MKKENAEQAETSPEYGKKAKYNAVENGEEKPGKTWKILHGLIDKCESLGEIISSCKSENNNGPNTFKVKEEKKKEE